MDPKKIQILHNSRCRKSRETLAIIEESSCQVNIIDYLKNPLSKNELKKIINKLDIKPIELIRKGEKIWKEKFKDKDMHEEEIIECMVKYPILIERPIVVSNNKAIIGRPPELVVKLLV
ncbi:MAG: arsenate reductase (glutaredoxin) [Bacteroidota bacterium]|nr:arsenate reductase (glutaredoxin) [Bacteroidota bacterium]